jgi:DNA primase
VGRIPDEDIQRVRDATDVVSVISDSVVLKKKGRLYWGLCPFHSEKTPSFKADPSTQLWHCFGCGKGGDVFGFLMDSEALEFPEAVRLLADRANIDIREQGETVPRSHKERLAEVCSESAAYYHRVLVSGREQWPERAREYLKRRGFGLDVAKRWSLGYAPGRGALVAYLKEKGFADDEMIDANVALSGDRGLRDRFYERVVFPIRDVQGRHVGFGGRVLGDGEPKYLNTQETPIFHKSRNLYAIDVAKNEIVKAGSAIVVEGYTDVIALHEAGVKNVVATLGTALTRQHVKLLSRFSKRIVYLFDADEAGLRAAERAAEFIDVSIGSEGEAIDLAVAVIPDSRDPAEFVADEGAEAVGEVVAAAQPLMAFVIDRRLARHDLDSPEGRSRALAAAAGVLASVKGSILAQDYAAYVADRLLVDVASVAAAASRARPEFGGSSRGETPDENAESPEDAVLDARSRAEREYVSLAVRHVGVRERASTALESGLVAGSRMRDLLGSVIESGGATGAELVDAVSSADASMAATLSGLAIGVDEAEDAEWIAQALETRLKEFALERQILEKRSRLKGTDPVKDREGYDELFKEIVSLQGELEEIRVVLRDIHDGQEA